MKITKVEALEEKAKNIRLNLLKEIYYGKFDFDKSMG